MYRWTNAESQDIVVEETHDFIGGVVNEVYDGNTFELYVTEEDYDNEHEYNQVEIVRIHGSDAPPIHTAEGEEAAEELRQEIEGEDLVVEVIGRDRQGRLIGTFELG